MSTKPWKCPKGIRQWWKKWKLYENGTWDVVELLRGKRTVGCKWIFTVKYKAGGSVGRHKARLAAKGFIQTYDIDYMEIFAPVAKLNTIRVLSLPANLNWPCSN